MTDPRQRAIALWSSGDYPTIAATLAPVAAEVVEAAGIREGQEVLDVAAGTGNATVEAARRGAKVIASDLTPAMLELGAKRTAEEGLDVGWIEADAQDLPFEDDLFDATISTFGAMFAPDQRKAASELVRVTKPGGTIAMSVWIPTPEEEYSQILAKHLPPPEGDSPFAWGAPGVAEERFAPVEVRTEARNLTLSFPDLPAAEYWFLEASFLPGLARAVLDDDGYEALDRDLRGWLGRQAAPDGTVTITDNPWRLILATAPDAS